MALPNCFAVMILASACATADTRFRPRRWVLMAAVLAAIVAWSCPMVGRAADAVPASIQPSEPRVQIRAEILKATPPGTTPQAVLDYIRKTLEPKSDAPVPALVSEPARGSTAQNSGKAGAQHICLVLGQYLRNPATFLMEIPIVTKTTTTVQWAFDKDGRLLEVFVDKDSELGDAARP